MTSFEALPDEFSPPPPPPPPTNRTGAGCYKALTLVREQFFGL